MNPEDSYFLEPKGEAGSACTFQEKNPTERAIEYQDGPSGDSTALSSSEYSVDANSCSRDGTDSSVRQNCPNYAMSQSIRDPNKSVLESVKNLDSPHNNDGDNTEDRTVFDSKISWTPPEAENEDDERENNSSNFDDEDEEFGDGMHNHEPCSLSEDYSKSQRLKEEKRKALGEVCNGKFKGMVSQLLNSVGLADSGDHGENWVDIVASLVWRAAKFVKPDYTEGKAMDPAGLVKIKCIQTGTRSQSQLVKGLVFKKCATHKNMPITYTNPRLLLIRGMLGETNEFTSLDSVKLDNVHLIEKLEASRPNVILVEKSVSRDIIDYIHRKEATLVSDVKLHRLERVSRCTGSPILSSDSLQSQQLKQCGKLHFKKFIEEHSVPEAGKKPSKILLFLEGCPIRLGCTILLKGSCSDELKKIKCVVQCAVVMAYHFIVETTFLLDQKLMFSTVYGNGVSGIFPTKQKSSSVGSVDSVSETAALQGCLSSSVSSNTETALVAASEGGQDGNGFHEKGTPCAPAHASVTEIAASQAVGIPPSNGFHGDVSHYMSLGLEGKCSLSDGADARKFLNTIGPTLSFSPIVYQPFSSFFGLDERVDDRQTALRTHGFPNAELLKQCDSEASDRLLHVSAEAVDASIPVIDTDDSILGKDDISSMLDAESILVLKSRRNVLKGTICEQSQFSNIKFYNNFDVPLGKFLLDNLLHQSLPCKTCGEPSEAHFYYYAHHNEQLTVRVKRLSERNLPGASEGKLWMWSRCGKCKPSSNIVKSTKRVLISATARGLSFGKFMELSFSNDSLFNRLSSCGHSIHRDFLYFFGFGPMVAMFRTSPVVKYSVSVPPLKLDFSNPNEGKWIEKETENVVNLGRLLFHMIADCLKENESRLADRILNLPGCPKEFTHIQMMLDHENNQFHANYRDICDQGCQPAYKMLHLNRLRCDLLLEAFVWNQRLQMLLSSDSTRCSTTSSDTLVQGKTDLKEAHAGEQKCEPIQSPRGDDHCLEIRVPHFDLHNGVDSEMEVTKASARIKSTQALEDEEHETTKIKERENLNDDQNYTDAAIPIDKGLGSAEPKAILGLGQLEIKDMLCNKGVEGFDEGDSINLRTGKVTPDLHSAVKSMETPSVHNHPHLAAENCQTSDLLFPGQLFVDETIPIMKVRQKDGSHADNTEYEKVKSPLIPSFQKRETSVWNTFSEIKKEHIKKVYDGHFLNFWCSTNVDGSFPPEVLALVSQVIMEEGSRHHIPLGDGDYVVSDYEGEISSIIACALAKEIDACPAVGKNLVVDPQKEKDIDSETTKGPVSLLRATSAPLARLPSRRLSELDACHLGPSMPLEHRFSSFDGLNPASSLSYFQIRHPEITLGGDKYPEKSKCSVVCMYATEFRALRERCCPSELDYIASLSRCRIWNAKGGKSKSFFAKTLDDRLIIKGIKKAEFEAFVQFAPKYFEYMQQAVGSRNQTCLAKVLGVYQVTVRQPKSGKEIKQDLMVMENLSFGRNITRQYDLKGALHARLSSGDCSGDVLLDQNFVNDMNASPMYIGKKAKRLIQRAVWNDTPFLRSLNVMDYSLLVVIDEQRKELVCGIIDYLRQYTWDKQLENWVKSSLVVPKNLLPTIISPEDYMKRFKKFMDIHFLTVPDNWCSHRSSKPCKLCGVKGELSQSLAKPKSQQELNGF